jgi:hypothetical protein
MAEERETNPFILATDIEDLGRVRALKDSF